MKLEKASIFKKIIIYYKWWGGLSSLDKLGNKDKSVCWQSIWRLFSVKKRVHVSKQQTYFYEDSGATAEKI